MQPSSHNEDSFLIRKLRDGDTSTFEELYHKHFARLYNFCFSLTQSSSDSDEIVQEAFIKVWEKRSNLDPEKNFSAYIYTIARNKIYKRSVQSIKKHRLEQDYTFLLPKESHITEDYINYKSLEKVVNNLISQLPGMQRQVFTMSRFNGLSNREIATKLQLSTSTVENHIYNALKSLKKQLFLLHYVLIFLYLGC